MSFVCQLGFPVIQSSWNHCVLESRFSVGVVRPRCPAQFDVSLHSANLTQLMKALLFQWWAGSDVHTLEPRFWHDSSRSALRYILGPNVSSVFLGPLEIQSAKNHDCVHHSKTLKAAALINLCTHSWPLKCWLIMFQIRQKRDNYLSFIWKLFIKWRFSITLWMCSEATVDGLVHGEKHRGLIDGEVRGQKEWQVLDPLENAWFNLHTKFIFKKSNRIERLLVQGFSMFSLNFGVKPVECVHFFVQY